MAVLSTHVGQLSAQLGRLDGQTIQVWLQQFVKEVQTRRGLVLAVVAYLVVQRVYTALVNVPPRLRHIKATDRIKEIKNVLQGKPVDERKLVNTVPLMARTGVGLFLSAERGTWTINVAEPKAARTLLMKTSVFQKAGFGNRPEDDLINKWIGNENIINSNGDAWKRHRKTANPAFHKSMPLQLFGRLTKSFIEQTEKANHRVQVTQIMQRFTLDAIGNGAFDYDFQALDHPSSEEINAYNNIMHIVFSPLNIMVPWLDSFLQKVSPQRRKEHSQVNLMNNLFARMIEKKRRTMTDMSAAGVEDAEKDLLTMMLEANEEEADPSKRLTDTELRGDMAVFFVAGHDTTSNALTFALYHLAVNPEVQRQAREESIRVLGDAPQDIVPNADQVKQLVYINQIIQETMRINPPAVTSGQRMAVEDTELGGYFIPKGSILIMDIWSLHHNPNVWNNPETWDPDRFAKGGEYESKDSYSYLPFGHGQRQCIGMQFSLAEQRVFLSMILRKYEISLPADSIHQHGLVMKPQLGVMNPRELILDFKPRY